MDDEQAKIYLDEIIGIEKVIAEFYNILYELELYDDKNNEMYDYYIKLLKEAILDEEKIFLAFNYRELDVISIYLDKNFDKIQSSLSDNSNDFYSFIIDRILIPLSKNDNSLNDIIIKIQRFAYMDMFDILFSFFDEEISVTSDRTIKQKLIASKYITCFLNLAKLENVVIDRRFDTEKSIYLSGELFANLEGIDSFNYNFYKSLLGFQLIDNVIELFKLLKKKQKLTEFDKMYLSLKFRAANLLIDMDTIRIIPQFKNVSSIDYTKDIDLYDLDHDIQEKIISDKERHKTLSLYKNNLEK